MCIFHGSRESHQLWPLWEPPWMMCRSARPMQWPLPKQTCVVWQEIGYLPFVLRPG